MMRQQAVSAGEAVVKNSMPGGENGKRKAGQKCWDFPEDKIPVLLNFINAQFC